MPGCIRVMSISFSSFGLWLALSAAVTDHWDSAVSVLFKMLVIAVLVALCATTAEIRAWDDSKYPDLKGQWVRAPGGGARYDWSKPAGRGQEAPLTPEYQTIYEATLADQAAGGQGGDRNANRSPSSCRRFSARRL